MKKFNFIWLGYADLMTAMFFVMLVMFCLVFALYTNQKDSLLKEVEAFREEDNNRNQMLVDARDSLRVAKNKFDKINEITSALDRMSDQSYFEYNADCKRHELIHGSLFKKDSFDIQHDQKARLISIGRQLAEVVNEVGVDDEVQYMLIIEGRAGRFEQEVINIRYNSFAKRLSFERARALYDLWEDNGIVFNEDICQVIISGSGYGGSCRYSGVEEAKNKTFIIQLIPKVGDISTDL